MSSSDLKENINKFNIQITKGRLKNIYLGFMIFICICHIIQTYREVTQKLIAKLQKLKKQKASAKCRYIFLSKCITHDDLPESFKTRLLLRTRRGFAATKTYNKEMLKITRDEARVQHIKLCKKISDVDNELQNKLTE